MPEPVTNQLSNWIMELTFRNMFWIKLRVAVGVSVKETGHTATSKSRVAVCSLLLLFGWSIAESNR